jgi:glyoxylase-like metal-dependent hydrolase (beta-lactamase superfamily II)
MRSKISRWVAALVAVVSVGMPAVMGAPIPPRATRAIGPFQVDTLLDGIHLFRPIRADGQHSNSLLIEREDGLLVVDSQPSPAAARDLLDALGRVSGKVVRYLVITHPHADAAGGAEAFPRSTLVVGSERCVATLGDPSFDFGAETRARAAPSRAWKEPKRPSVTLALSSAATLHDPRYPVTLLPLPGERAHSPGDMVVWIRPVDLLAVGDLVASDRNPFGSGASIGGWIASLNSIAEMRPRILVPLRGPAVDDREARLTRDALAWVRGQVDAAFVDLVPSGRIADRVLASPTLPQHVDIDAAPSLARTVVEQAVEDAVEYRRKRGIE